MLYHVDDYREILQLRFDQRHARNPAYSLRAFARDLKISPSRLSEVLSRRHHLSLRTAGSVGRQLEFDADEFGFFCDLVESQTARTTAQREQARARLLKFRFNDDESRLRVDQFKAISDWYHFALVELFKTRSFRADPHWMGRALGISAKTVREALGRLERLGFIATVSGQPELRRSRSFTDSDTPAQALRDFHRQILERAAFALHSQSKEGRISFSAVAAIDAAGLVTLREDVKDLVAKFVMQNAKQRDADHVYCLTVQAFKLDEGKAEHDELS